MKLTFEKDSSYGRKRFYPKCDVSSRLAMWKGKKTFDANDIADLHAMGFEITVKLPTIETLSSTECLPGNPQTTV